MIEKTFSIEINAPIQAVWDEITREHGLQKAMFNCAMEVRLEPGGTLRYRDASGKHCFVWGDVLEVDPPRRWVYSFAFSGMDEPPTRVEWNLEETAPGVTRVTVLHSGFPSENKTFKSVRKVWPQILGRLRDVLEKGDVSVGTRMRYAMMSATSFMIPKSMKSENVERYIAERRQQS